MAGGVFARVFARAHASGGKKRRCRGAERWGDGAMGAVRWMSESPGCTLERRTCLLPKIETSCGSLVLWRVLIFLSFADCL